MPGPTGRRTVKTDPLPAPLLRELSRSANYRYEGLEPLLATLAEQVIAPAEGR